ncbi:tRNA-specific adenosine deaminase [BD1-7 clade bacterium]|uniref:tRNA-specific adenosine deaminase n=1 Tax=BD1-7 clade bacterium TaxID=2029982 RepID=A0A5S9PHK1_9GAMM|nr:tRNA-specific adenosine deaminase [BD1-7 clade bacterium]CAA0103688.1 tRNA-specific adenosine deaminase [BD1-7 clade bacterium]
MTNINHSAFMSEAINEAQKGLAEGGVPIGCVVVLDGEIIGRGHNQRIQEGSVIKHAEMDALENTGRLSPSQYRACTLYTTLSPCPMCSGAVRLYGIKHVVIRENKTFQGDETFLESEGVTLTIIDDPTCIDLMTRFIEQNPELWQEDIGELE